MSLGTWLILVALTLLVQLDWYMTPSRWFWLGKHWRLALSAVTAVVLSVLYFSIAR